MFSKTIKDALQQEVIGQPFAVNSVVRGVTRLLSGMTPRERSWCAYLFIGPPGTGRAHLVRTLARILHGNETVLTVNCNMAGQPDPWLWFSQQLAPLVARQLASPTGSGRPPALLLIQDLERARPEFYPMLARLLETGQLVLPGGRHGQLDNCMIFMTSGLCAHEILDARIGFSSTSPEEDEQLGAIINVCRGEAETAFGIDLLAQIDNMVVFSRLEPEHLALVLERHLARMNRWLAQRGVQCTLEPTAQAFLMVCASGHTNLGAHDLILAHRSEVEFPVADLLISGRLDPGTHVIVEHKPGEDHLHFTLRTTDERIVDNTLAAGVHEVPVG